MFLNKEIYKLGKFINIHYYKLVKITVLSYNLHLYRGHSCSLQFFNGIPEI